jgi:hypothetical protein
MSGYDSPNLRCSYSFGDVDYQTAGSLTIARPAGVRFCRIVEVSLSGKTTFAGSTSTPGPQIGVSGSAGKFMNRANMALAAGGSISFIEKDMSAVGAVGYTQAKGLIDLDTCSTTGTAVSSLLVTFIAGVGGSPAGVAYTTVTLEWW